MINNSVQERIAQLEKKLEAVEIYVCTNNATGILEEIVSLLKELLLKNTSSDFVVTETSNTLVDNQEDYSDHVAYLEEDDESYIPEDDDIFSLKPDELYDDVYAEGTGGGRSAVDNELLTEDIDE
jgi:hypothetical protein